MSVARNRVVYEHWMAIQDIIGDAKLWPKSTRKLFWTTHLRHFQRILIATFAYVNGLSPELFMEWARLMDLGRDSAAYRHFDALFRIFPNRNYKMYAFHVANNRYEYLDGSVRQYTHRTLRQ